MPFPKVRFVGYPGQVRRGLSPPQTVTLRQASGFGGEIPEPPGWLDAANAILARPGDRDGKARGNYAGTSPVTRASGEKKVVAARFIRNDRLVDALNAQAFAALNASPGARAFAKPAAERDPTT
jgi:hypothetical protein